MKRVRGGDKPTREEELAAVKKKIWDAVAAGKISEEDAQKRWEAYRDRRK